MMRLAGLVRPAHFHVMLAVLALILAALPPAALRAQPSLSHATPGAMTPGKTTELVLSGAKLDGTLALWTSFPAQVELAPGDPAQKDRTSVTAKIALPAGAPCGVAGVAIANASGISDVLYLMIDDLPSAADSGNNHSPAAPQDIGLPVAIDGVCDGTVFDYYRFSAKAGQKISCEVVATRLGWDFDPVVRVLDAAGNEVLRADDDPATAADTRFVFAAPADGQYVIELRDNRYKPGGRYRLRLGDFPLVSTPLPLVATSGIVSQLGFSGPLTENAAPISVLTAAARSDVLPLSVKGASGQSGWTTLLATDKPVALESSPADKPDEPTPAEIPGYFAGKLDPAKDRDQFQFTAAKGTPVSFKSLTRSAGSGAILMLRLTSAPGNQIAESPLTDSDEPVLNFTIPEDGAYRLSVEELAGRGGPDYTYAVEARTGPQFTLSLKNDANNRIRHSLSPGDGTFHLDVQCQRFAYDGPITLGVESSRLGWQVFNRTIPAKANELRLYIVAPLDFSPGELAELRIVGRADASGRGASATMTTTVQLRAARPQTPFPPPWLDGAILVSALAEQSSFYTVTADKAEVSFPRLVGETKLTLALKRTDPKFKDTPLVVMPLGLPAGITPEIKRNGNGPDETYDITLKGPKDLTEGSHSFRYFAFAEVGTDGRSVQSGDIRLSVITPLAVAAAPAGPLVQGQKQKVKLSLTRRGDDKQPVDLKFKALPAGVTAPEKTTLAADQNEVEVELSAAADAAPVKFDQLIAVATSKYVGTDLTVESPAVALEVKAP
ncbi:MAG: pre-peptidase C-terminal domain-containing protein [Planctomycetaceae bacterium]|nr:pre-peptidase C-terminal domain-containing protein [Planctomycetaceae bacterium]